MSIQPTEAQLHLLTFAKELCEDGHQAVLIFGADRQAVSSIFQSSDCPGVAVCETSNGEEMRVLVSSLIGVKSFN